MAKVLTSETTGTPGERILRVLTSADEQVALTEAINAYGGGSMTTEELAAAYERLTPAERAQVAAIVAELESREKCETVETLWMPIIRDSDIPSPAIKNI